MFKNPLSGTHFDPDIVKAFIAATEEIKII